METGVNLVEKEFNMVQPIHGTLTSNFHEIRPLSLQRKIKEGHSLTKIEKGVLHIHGAVDIANVIGSLMLAPEDGRVFSFMTTRSRTNEFWKEGEGPKILGKTFPYKNYFYDLYGGLTVLLGNSGRVYLFCHIFGNHLFNKNPITLNFDKPYCESKAKSRFPLMAFYSKPVFIKEGCPISKMGDAGYSTGPHVHLEVHPSYRLYKYSERIDPLLLFPGMGTSNEKK